MNRMSTKKLAMAARALEFLRAHPFTDRNQAAVASQFATQLEQAQALLLAEQNERLAAATAKRRGAELRRELEANLLPGMERIGAFALRADAQEASRFTPASRRRTEAGFIARASNLLEAARAHQETLARSGLARATIHELANGLSQFRDATSQAHTRRQQHHDTRTELERAMADLTEQLRLLDAYNRVRFQRDAALLERWTTLRTIGRQTATRSKNSGGEVAPPAPTPAQAASTEPPQDGRPSAAA